MKTRNIVILSVLATIAFLYIGLPIVSGGAISVLDLYYYVGIENQRSQLIAEYGGSGIIDKHGTLCTTTTYQSWDNTCNFDLPRESLPPEIIETGKSIPAQLTTEEWREYRTQSYIELESYKISHKYDPEKYCNLFQEKINEIEQLGFEASQLVLDYKSAYKYWKCENP